MSLLLVSRTCLRCASSSTGSNAKTRALLDRVLRVDHAGEYGAVQIYKGQMAVLGNTKIGPILEVSLLLKLIISNATCLDYVFVFCLILFLMWQHLYYLRKCASKKNTIQLPLRKFCPNNESDQRHCYHFGIQLDLLLVQLHSSSHFALE